MPQNPERLREELVTAEPKQVVIDEVQKVPALLDEVHWLHENRSLRFAPCGSSARHDRYELHGLTATELGDAFDLSRLLNRGYLPRIFSSEKPAQLLESYVADYLKEEIAAEGLVRNLPVFSAFLDTASFSDTELVSFATLARDCGVSPRPLEGISRFSSTRTSAAGFPATRRGPSAG
jgi:predicted AAA+ superfamily ATPase